MKRVLLPIVILCFVMSANARTPKPPISVCKNELRAVTKALNACPEEIQTISTGYHFGEIKYTQSLTKLMGDQGDKVSIQLLDTKNKPAGFLNVEFGAVAMDGGPQRFQCDLKVVSRPSNLGVICTMDALVCGEGLMSENFIENNECVKRCVPSHSKNQK